MPRRAWAYIWAVLLLGVAFALLSPLARTPTQEQCEAFIPLLLLATVAQLAKAEAPNHTLYYATPVFVFAAVLLLPPCLLVPVIAVPSLIEWAKERWQDSRHLRAWYLQPFNIAMYVIAACSAQGVLLAIDPSRVVSATVTSAVAVGAALAMYLILNHLLLLGALVLARGLSWRSTGQLEPESLFNDLVLLCLGAVVAAFWQMIPWLIVPALAPLVLLYRALLVPQLKHQALTDSITALGNHRAYQEAFSAEITQAHRRAEPLSLALIDLDDFKVINDTHGHKHGDRVLALLGTLLRAAHDQSRAFRLGGDEFALLLPNTSAEQALALLEEVRRQAESGLFGGTLSIGVTSTILLDTQTPTLHEEADAALYEAKHRGRNMVVAFEQIREQTAITSATKIVAVRQLLAARQMAVVFQPIWDLERGGILAFEALSRPNPGYSLSGPLEAFEVAEQIGRAHELDLICHQAILSRTANLPDDISLFMNISPQTLEHGCLAGDALVHAVEAAGLAPSRVVLELTERAVTRPDVVVREAQRLRALGFRLALDDIGAGNAGLEMLSQLVVDYVKIDRAVVANALTNNTARSVLAAIIAFAHQAGSHVIAEGIETDEMLRMVQDLGSGAPWAAGGVFGAQGYLLGRPSETISVAVAVPRALTA